MSSMELEVLSIVIDLLDLGRFVSNTLLAIPNLSSVRPRCVPETIHDVHVLIGNLVPLVVRHQVLPKSVCRRL